MDNLLDDSFNSEWLKVTEEMRANAEILQHDLESFDNEAFQHSLENLNFEFELIN